MSTPAQIEANRANALLSTGPSSPASKAKCSLNALKTGLTGRTILLPSDDVEKYQRYIARQERQFEPQTDQEKELVQSIADTEWHLLRIPLLEAGVYAAGRIECSDLYSEQTDPHTRASLIERHIFKTNRKELSNIHLQEVRLLRRRQQETDHLTKLQDDRQVIDKEMLKRAYTEFMVAFRARQPFDESKFGFAFSSEFLRARYEHSVYASAVNLEPFDRSWKLNGRSMRAERTEQKPGSQRVA